MHGNSAPLSRIIVVGLLAAWGVVALAMGLLVMFEWPARVGFPARWALLFGVALVGVGQFMSAVAADQLFPGAHRRVTGFLELAPWVAVVATTIGGVLWAS